MLSFIDYKCLIPLPFTYSAYSFGEVFVIFVSHTKEHHFPDNTPSYFSGGAFIDAITGHNLLRLRFFMFLVNLPGKYELFLHLEYGPLLPNSFLFFTYLLHILPSTLYRLKYWQFL
jgi:hypothetical protein